MTGLLFDLAFWCAAPVWALMVLAPRWSVTVRIASSPWTALPVLAVYTALALAAWPELWALVSSPTLEGMHRLTALAGGAGAVWAQIIAWDLLIGQWIFLEARRLRLNPLVTSPLLVLTILLSPFALLLFLLLRAALGRRRRDGTGTPGTPPTRHSVAT
ncbi:ABA4-like family protein [Streptomyces sp. NPDC002490]|uniref:ABA4-like family protein n=1 Tax=Streptomyces sp. NPDC002490 TaxID=3154416 RepID=UPI00331F67C5